MSASRSCPRVSSRTVLHSSLAAGRPLSATRGTNGFIAGDRAGVDRRRGPMSDTSAVEEAEAIVLDLTRRLTGPADRECLFCYVVRMLDNHGCDNTLRWAGAFREVRAPRASS